MAVNDHMTNSTACPTDDATTDTKRIPDVGDAVEVFSARAGWRHGTLHRRLDWGTLIQFDDRTEVLVHLPFDFDQGDMRWPIQHKSAQQRELEGQRVLVPCEIFAQEGQECYAGVVKDVDKGACVFFPIDAKKVSFPLTHVRKWLLGNETKEL